MSDAYWRYTDPRQQQQQQQPQAAPSLAGKRPRSDYDAPSGRDLSGYYSREDDRASHQQMQDTASINQSYDRYLRSGQVPYPADSGRLHSSSHPVDDPRISSDHRAGIDPRFDNDPHLGNAPRISSDHRVVSEHHINSDPRMGSVMDLKGRGSDLVSGRSEIALPPDASKTIFVEGLPSNCSRREVAHIFRPFVGYKEVRLVTKDSRRPGGDPLVLCFVDFLSPPHAATALDALHGYKFDENDRDSAVLRLQFARHPPGARSGGGHRSRR